MPNPTHRRSPTRLRVTGKAEQALAEAAVAGWPLARVEVSRKRFRGWFKS